MKETDVTEIQNWVIDKLIFTKIRHILEFWKNVFFVENPIADIEKKLNGNWWFVL